MKLLVFCLALLFPIHSFTQMDTAFIAKIKSLDTANILKLDTAAVPNDVLTAKIKQLRSEKKGLTLETILKIKLSEEQQKDTSHSKAYYDALVADVTKGKTSKLIENSLINLYRNNFTEQEIDDVIKFYKTSAGKKMDKEYILLMVESIKDAEQLIKLAAKNIDVK
ncbi:MAG: DUF2059 domain-containing protein [Bacteroidota bacterium]|nr:DUF2059 domain-containing protein [Bacteroidota bacterium]